MHEVHPKQIPEPSPVAPLVQEKANHARLAAAQELPDSIRLGAIQNVVHLCARLQEPARAPDDLVACVPDKIRKAFRYGNHWAIVKSRVCNDPR
jgi:hypothetical protein